MIRFLMFVVCVIGAAALAGPVLGFIGSLLTLVIAVTVKLATVTLQLCAVLAVVMVVVMACRLHWKDRKKSSGEVKDD